MKRIVVLLEPITVRVNVINIPPSVSFDTLLIQLSCSWHKIKTSHRTLAQNQNFTQDVLPDFPNSNVTGFKLSQAHGAQDILMHVKFCITCFSEAGSYLN